MFKTASGEEIFIIDGHVHNWDATKPGITVTYMPAMIRIDGEGKIEFRMDEIAAELGREMTAQLFEISTSTHYGRMVTVDENTVVLFGDMNAAMEYVAYA